MCSVRTHFEALAAGVGDRAFVETVEKDGAVTIRLLPRTHTAVGVKLYLSADEVGTVALDDPACGPAELGGDPIADCKAVDRLVAVAVEGRATAFHLGGGGCIEVRDGDKTVRTWHNAWPWPGWRRHARRVAYAPYT